MGDAAIAIADSLSSSITKVVNLLLDEKCPSVLGCYIASAPLTLLVKPGGCILPIIGWIVWHRLVSKVATLVVGKNLNAYFKDYQFGLGTQGGSEAILHNVNKFVEYKGDVVGFSMLLMDFENTFNLVDRSIMLFEIRIQCPSLAPWVEF